MQGLILLDKPKGISSFGAVARVRRICGEKRVGHTGTLDPFATGVLPVLLGRATRLCSYVRDESKSYTATVTLGVTTDTQDSTGTITEQRPVTCSRGDIESVLATFRGDGLQIPPMFSAVHVNGKRLYELARAGKEIEREARPITIERLELTSLDGPQMVLDVTCSKGTYIRTLVHDIGQALGCGAAVCELRRTAAAGFSIDRCVTLEQLEQDPASHLLDTETVLMHLPAVTVTEKQALRVQNGGELSLDRCSADAVDGQQYRIRFNDELLALGQVDTTGGALKIKCLLKEGTL